MSSVKISGLVEIDNGNNHIESSNKLTNGIVEYLYSFMTGRRWSEHSNDTSYNFDVRLGDDTSAGTSPSDDSLVSPIGTSYNSLGGETVSTGSAYDLLLHATWHAGTVSGTLGEVGIFKDVLLNGFASDVDSNDEQERMLSRLASADGEFSSFVIDESKPLTIDWTIRFEFV